MRPQISLQCRRYFGAEYETLDPEIGSMPPSWIVTGCLTGRGLVQRLGRGWGEGKIFFFPSPFAYFLHLTPTPSANISSPQSSGVTESKMRLHCRLT